MRPAAMLILTHIIILFLYNVNIATDSQLKTLYPHHGGGSPTFKETHTLYSFLYDLSIAAGRHLGPDKDDPFCYCFV